jgi:hypothetical protein
MIWDDHPRSWIRIQIFFSIPDPGSKGNKTPDPRSATLHFMCITNLFVPCQELGSGSGFNWWIRTRSTGLVEGGRQQWQKIWNFIFWKAGRSLCRVGGLSGAWKSFIESRNLYFFLVGHQKPSLVLDSNLMNMDLKHCFEQVLEPQLFRVKCSPWFTYKAGKFLCTQYALHWYPGLKPGIK